MRAAYLDTSFLLAEAFGEPRKRGRPRIGDFDVVFAARLLEAEYRCAFHREGVPPLLELLAPIHWIDPRRSLSDEIGRVLNAGYVRGADCWHLATALYVATEPTDLTFLTVDDRQASVADALGFR